MFASLDSGRDPRITYEDGDKACSRWVQPEQYLVWDLTCLSWVQVWAWGRGGGTITVTESQTGSG